VRKLEELGIGRPSTYAPTISTIQQREYVEKGDKKGEERNIRILTLTGDKIKSQTKKENSGNEKGKLLPTDIGIVVNDFLSANFPNIMDYNFTADVEKKFDDVAEGKKEWTKLMKDFYKKFEPQVEKTINNKLEHKVGEHLLGTDPVSGKPVYAKIGRYGTIIQIGSADDEEKPRFAQMHKGQSMESITLEEALELFKLPRTVGTFEDTDVVIGTGRFGPYVLHNKSYVSLPKDADPMTITLEEAIKLIEDKRKAEKERHIKSFTEDPDMELLNGRYGPYIAYKGKNYRLPKDKTADVSALTLEECLAIVKEQDEHPTKRAARPKRSFAKKK
jgi:DNA topoisomerase-1